MTFDDIIDMKVGSTSVESAWFNGQQVWPTDVSKNLPVQSLMKGCTVTADGVVKYLNPTDQTKYQDSTDMETVDM